MHSLLPLYIITLLHGLQKLECILGQYVIIYSFYHKDKYMYEILSRTITIFECEQPSNLEIYSYSCHAVVVVYMSSFSEVQGVDIILYNFERCTCKLYLSLIIEAYMYRQRH